MAEISARMYAQHQV
jgi:pimeloyl-ACP methyl ester carboxylesterase